MDSKQNPSRAKKYIFRIVTVLLVLALLYQCGAMVAYHFIFRNYQPSGNGYCRHYEASDEEAYPRENFTFTSGDNQLTARFYPAKDPKATLIIAHGFHSYGDRFFELAAYFVDRGFNVITYNETGTADSEGLDTVGLTQMRLDLINCIEQIEDTKYTRNGALPIVLLGHSMGAYSVATALKSKTQIAAAICVAPFDRPTQVMYDYSKDFVGVFSDITYPAMYLQSFFLFGADHDLSASEVLSKTSVPTLIVYGDHDTIVTPELAAYSHRDEINNPLVTYRYIEDEYRGTHTTMWYTEESAKEVISRSDNQPYDGTYPELDAEFMESLYEFYSEHLER